MALGTLIKTTVLITYISGERLWSFDKQLPPQVQISVNINVVGIEHKGDTVAEAPFVFTVNYVPSVAQISIKGTAQVSGDKEEITKLVEDHKQQKAPPAVVVQALSNMAMLEAVILSKSLSVPPPLPPIPVPQAGPTEQRRTDTRYTA